MELALVVCKASVLPKDDPNIAKTAQLALETMSVELATAACDAGALNAASPDTAVKLLRLGVKARSANLLLAVTLVATALAAVAKAMLWDALQFALELALVELVLNICRAGALDGVVQGTATRVLDLALDQRGKVRGTCLDCI